MRTRAGRPLLYASFAVLIGWPLLATVLEAGHVPWRLERSLRSVGLDHGADLLARVWGQDPEPATGTALDPVATAEMLDSGGRLARPVRLALETMNLVLWVLLLAIPPATLLALLVFRTDLWGREWLLCILLVVVFVPLPLYATSWLGALGNIGRVQAIGARPVLVGRTGAAIVHALAGFPWAVLILGIGLRTVESELEEAALLEMGTLRVWIRVTLRRSVGFLAAAALALAVLTAGDMTVTDLLQVRTYAEEAYTQYSLGRGPAEAAAVSLPPLLVIGLAIVLAARWLARSDPARLAAAYSRSHRWPLGRWRVPAGILSSLLVLALLAVPLYGLLWRAGRVGGRARLGLPPAWSLSGLWGTLGYSAAESAEPIAVSMALAAAGATVAAVLAWWMAWSSRRSRAARVLLVVSLVLTLATPGPVAGMALKLGYRWFSWIHDTSVIVIMAEAIRTLPYALLILWPALTVLPPELLESASLEGYGPAGQACRVALPLTWQPLLAAWFVAFVLGLGELPATNLVLPPGLTTITFRLWALLHTGVESHLAGVALVTLGVFGGLVLAMLAASRSLGSRAG